MGPGVGHAIFESTDSLDPGGYEDIPFTGLDGVESHADGLQRGRAVAVDCDSRDIWHTCQDSHNTCQVETGLTSRFTAAKHKILYSAWIELGYLREYSTHNRGGEVIGSALDK